MTDIPEFQLETLHDGEWVRGERNVLHPRGLAVDGRVAMYEGAAAGFRVTRTDRPRLADGNLKGWSTPTLRAPRKGPAPSRHPQLKMERAPAVEVAGRYGKWVRANDVKAVHVFRLSEAKNVVNTTAYRCRYAFWVAALGLTYGGRSLELLEREAREQGFTITEVDPADFV